jgi:hypothetical protein
MALVMGALVEAAEGIAGTGNCRLRDLVPDSAGAVVGAVSVYCWARIKGSWPSRGERPVSGHSEESASIVRVSTVDHKGVDRSSSAVEP